MVTLECASGVGGMTIGGGGGLMPTGGPPTVMGGIADIRSRSSRASRVKAFRCGLEACFRNKIRFKFIVLVKAKLRTPITSASEANSLAAFPGRASEPRVGHLWADNRVIPGVRQRD
jgi:hypothetical protein